MTATSEVYRKLSRYLDNHMAELTDDQIWLLMTQLDATRQARRKVAASKVRHQLNIGDPARFIIGCRPKYLQGQTGTIIEKRGTRALVKLDAGAMGKFRSGTVLTPYSLLEKLS